MIDAAWVVPVAVLVASWWLAFALGKAAGREMPPPNQHGPAARCRCGHLRAAHIHHNRGRYCGACKCDEYKGAHHV